MIKPEPTITVYSIAYGLNVPNRQSLDLPSTPDTTGIIARHNRFHVHEPPRETSGMFAEIQPPPNRLVLIVGASRFENRPIPRADYLT